MLQIAVLVDAGYLFAQGSALLNGSKVPRHLTRINAPVVLDALTQTAKDDEPNARLLRIYWYDGLSRGAIQSPEQRTIAESPNVKCRFGTINSHGQQKGVDSLIITDIIELARGQAISDALIIAGDEDLRVGVQLAQAYGIRIHLLGIKPARASQSPDLRAEADTLHEWDETKVGSWLQIVNQAKATVLPTTQQSAPRAANQDEESDADSDESGCKEWLAATIDAVTAFLTPSEADEILAFAGENHNALPADFDRPMLAQAGRIAGKELSPEDRRLLRNEIRKALASKATHSE